MKLLLTLVIVSITVGACVEAGIKFERMNEAELAAYNENKPLDQMIVCRDDPKPFSRVSRRWCATVEQMYGSAAQAQQLDVLNAPTTFADGSASF